MWHSLHWRFYLLFCTRNIYYLTLSATYIAQIGTVDVHYLTEQMLDTNVIPYSLKEFNFK